MGTVRRWREKNSFAFISLSKQEETDRTRLK